MGVSIRLNTRSSISFTVEIQYKNLETCRRCLENRRCCRIYDNDDGGIRNKSMWFDEWCGNFHLNKENYDVEPLFDPLFVHMGGNEQELEKLMEAGIDPFACEYLGPDGCKIDWNKRPLHCRAYKCERLTEDDATHQYLI